MATTYGYGGEFSSDEDIDRLEQQSEAKFGTNLQASTKPSRQQIEEIIETIRQFPVEQEVNLGDEQLIGLLDYYKVARGPVVDSTRKLYKRLILKRIRDDQQQTAANGEATNNLNGNSDNNNSINIISKRLAQVEPASSDDDEPMPPASSQSSVEQSQAGRRKQFDSRVAYDTDKPEPMEIDPEQHSPVTPLVSEIRTTKQVDISDSEDESDKESKSGDSSDSEELDITPPKYPNQQQHQQQQVTQATSKIIASTPIKDVASKIAPVTPKEAAKSKSKAPQYTRSQRVATRSSSGTSKTASKKSTDVSSSKVDDGQPQAQVPSLNKSTLTSFENCSRGLSKVKLESPFNLSVVEDENGDIAFGTTINGSKLNYAQKMVLSSMLKQAKRNKTPLARRST